MNKLIRYEYPNEMNQWLDQAFNGLGRWPSVFENVLGHPIGEGRLPLDLYEDEHNYYVHAEMPGVKKKDINLQLERAVLTITAERKQKNKDGEQSFSYTRSVTVGDDVIADKVSAKFEDGVLTVTLPKKEERKPKAIAVD